MGDLLGTDILAGGKEGFQIVIASFGDVTGLDVVGDMPGAEVKGCGVAGTDVVGALMLDMDGLGLDLALRSRSRMGMRTSTDVDEACCEK